MRQRKRPSLVGYDSFFYPLDSIRQWNLLYGKQGFLQYQCVIPETNVAAIEELLDRIARSGMGSFLGVLKEVWRRAGGWNVVLSCVRD